jgi:hypothetical protein
MMELAQPRGDVARALDVAAVVQRPRPRHHQARIEQVVRRALDRVELLRRPRRRRRGGVVGVMREQDAALAARDALGERRGLVRRLEDRHHGQIVEHGGEAAEHHQQAGNDERAGFARAWRRRFDGRRDIGSAAQAQPEQECRRQQEVGVPQRVLQHAVQRDDEQHHGGGAQRRTLFPRGFARCREGAPQRPREHRHDEGAERNAQFDDELQRQVVRVVEEFTGPVGKGRQRPREVELADADAEPRVLPDQRQRIGPDGIASRDKRAVGHARLTTEYLVLLPRPRCHGQPAGGIGQRQRAEQPAHATVEAPLEHAPRGEQQHADGAGARCGQHDAKDDDRR